MDEKRPFCPSCADCAQINCDWPNSFYPEFCLTTHMDEADLQYALGKYDEGDNRKIMLTAAEVEYEGYLKINRVQETINFMKKMGYQKIGIASCVGLYNEARITARILRAHDFEVYAVACKAGAVKKSAVGIKEECMSIAPNMCNPILQAHLLEKQQTEFNIVVGLCVGHDSLFFRHSHAPVTTLVVKDRIMGHNPAAALYTTTFYNKKLLHPPKAEF